MINEDDKSNAGKFQHESWERQGVHVLNSLNRLEINSTSSREDIAEIREMLVGLNTKFDRYNNFNDKLNDVEKKVIGLQNRVGYIVVGLGLAVTIIFNLLSDFVRKALLGG